jgi:hypothetical protein
MAAVSHQAGNDTINSAPKNHIVTVRLKRYFGRLTCCNGRVIKFTVILDSTPPVAMQHERRQYYQVAPPWSWRCVFVGYCCLWRWSFGHRHDPMPQLPISRQLGRPKYWAIFPNSRLVWRGAPNLETSNQKLMPAHHYPRRCRSLRVVLAR